MENDFAIGIQGCPRLFATVGGKKYLATFGNLFRSSRWNTAGTIQYKAKINVIITGDMGVDNGDKDCGFLIFFDYGSHDLCIVTSLEKISASFSHSFRLYSMRPTLRLLVKYPLLALLVPSQQDFLSETMYLA